MAQLEGVQSTNIAGSFTTACKDLSLLESFQAVGEKWSYTETIIRFQHQEYTSVWLPLLGMAPKRVIEHPLAYCGEGPCKT